MSGNNAIICTAEAAPGRGANVDMHLWFGSEEAMLPAHQVMWASLALIGATLAVLLVG